MPDARLLDFAEQRMTRVTESAAARSHDDDPPRRWPERGSPESLQPGEWPRRAGRRAAVVLVVDDSRDAREMYATFLSHAGFGIFTAQDGAAAVDIAIQVRPDVIVMDLSMPTLDGIDATRRIREHPRTREIPVILLTGFPQQAIERDALAAGVTVFLTKPCLPEDLETHVRQRLKTPPKSP
jgi:two-component system cell cycle response regulator DivK